MNIRLMALAISISLLILPNQLLADIDVLIIGSTHTFSEGNESGVVQQKAFNPSTIATHLHSIIDQDPLISEAVNVEFEDIYKTKAQTVNYSGAAVYNFTSRCYSLAQHYMWPEGKTERMANLRGEGTRQWDYIILCNDPYIMANFPGMVAEGVKLIKDEVAKSANPAQIILLGQWPDTTSTFTANQFNEILYRVGNTPGVTVVPAGKAWSSYSSKDTSANHPTPRGEYLAAASIYSKIYNRSAKTSAYDYPSVGDAIADHALSVIQANNGVAQYSGTYTSINPFQMKYVNKRTVSYRETGSSTEDGMAAALGRLDDVHRITFNTTAVNGKWDFNYGRGNDWWEDDKDYEVDATKHDRAYGFPMHHYNMTTSPITMPYGIDKHYCNGYNATEWIYNTYEDGTDLGIAYNMVRPGPPTTRERGIPEGEDVRSIPIRLMWLKMVQQSPGFNPLGDSTHMHAYLHDATVSFMYTLLSGRCPVVNEPTPQGSSNPAWMQWLGHKTGYETAWQMSHLTTRAPGFRVLPSATAATTLTPSATETMTVQFMNPPQSNVTVNISVSNTNAASLSTQTLTFTPANYNTPQQVVVTGLAGALGSEAFNVVFSTTSADEIYNQLSDSWGYTINRPITVTFDANGGSAASPANKTVTPSTTYGTLATTSRAGFTFNGWFTAASGGTLVTSATTVTIITSHTLYAQWSANSTATFDANGGTTPSPTSKSVTAGLPYGTLATTSRVGYTFNGWFTATSGGSLVTSATTVTASADHTLYAQWTVAATYTVTYLGNGNNGGTVPSNQTKTNSVDLVLATNTGNLTKTGFIFSGWNTASDGSGVAYAAGATYTGNAALTLYARWNVSPVVNAGSDQSVTLGASVAWSPSALAPQLWLDASTATNNAGTVSITNAGSGGGTVSGPAALAASGIGTLQAVQFDGNGKYLTGDYTNTSNTLSAFFVGKSLNSAQTAYAGMMSVWANGQGSDWNNAGSAVIFNQNNTTANSIQTYRGSTALSSTTGSLTAGFLTGAVFNGTTNTTYLNGTPASSPNSSGNFNANKVVLGARWHTSIFNYSWNGNFGEAIICNSNLNTSDREKVEGYLAHKWGLAGSLPSGHPHKDLPPGVTGAAATLDGTATDTDTLTYAWTVVSGPASVSFTDATAIDTTANFTAAGAYTLRLTASDGLAQSSDDIVVTVNAPGSNHPLTYDGNGSTGGSVPVDSSSPYANGSTVTVLGNTGSLVRTGHTFNNWNTASNGSGTNYSPAATFGINTPTTLYAKWTINQYTINFNSAGGSAVTAMTQNFGSTVTPPANPTRSGYTFAGWSPALPSTMPASNQTVTAQWNAIPAVNAGSDQTVYLTQSAPWSPSSLSPQLWLDADDTNSITFNGTKLAQWDDKSTFGRHATATGTAQPTATSNGLNGKRVITFDGSANALNVNLDFLAGVSHSAFIVTQPTIFQNIYGAANGNAGANSLHVGFANNTTYRMNYWTNDYGPAVTSNFVSGSANIMNYIWTSGTSKQILANGKSEGTQGTAGVIGTMSGGGRIGSAVGQGFFGGDIAEIIILTGNVAAADREKMEGYLAHKWGLTGNLPAGHSYLVTPPGGSGSSAIANLDGSATDADALTYTWSVVSGPASVTFGNASAIDTTATFTVAGTYTLRLTANDGYGSTSSDLVITVSNPTPYSTWTSGTFSNSFTDTALTSNPDGDNLTNLQEFAFGTDPTSASLTPLTYVLNGTTNPGIPVLENTGTPQSPVYRAVFARRKNHATEGITYEVQFSANLQYWKASSTGMTILSGTSTAAVEAVSVPFPATVPLSAAETQFAAPKFFRVAVTEN